MRLVKGAGGNDWEKGRWPTHVGQGGTVNAKKPTDMNTGVWMEKSVISLFTNLYLKTSPSSSPEC